VFVSLAKMKDHANAGVTLAMKNCFGITPCTIYGSGSPENEPGDVPRGGRSMFHSGDRQPARPAPPENDPKSPREGGYRVPALIRWPCVIRPGTIYNEFFAHEDFLPTFAAVGGNVNIVEQCQNTCQLGGKSFHVHLDGYDLVPFFKGEVKESPRREFLYWSDDGDLFALRYNQWKVVFIEQNHEGLDVWMQGFNKLRIPKIFNLRADPFERGDSSFLYNDWFVHHVFITYGAQGLVANWIKSFKDYPIRQRPASFNLDEVMQKLAPPQ
jgi:arylsulfatase